MSLCASLPPASSAAAIFPPRVTDTSVRVTSHRARLAQEEQPGRKHSRCQSSSCLRGRNHLASQEARAALSDLLTRTAPNAPGASPSLEQGEEFGIPINTTLQSMTAPESRAWPDLCGPQAELVPFAVSPELGTISQGQLTLGCLCHSKLLLQGLLLVFPLSSSSCRVWFCSCVPPSPVPPQGLVLVFPPLCWSHFRPWKGL